jgi:Ca2+-transporting ATPase
MSVDLSRSGLTSAQAAESLARDGYNRLVPEDRGRRWKRWLGPFADPMVALLLVAAPTYLAIGETTDAIVAFVALVPIAAVGWVLESRAEHTLDQLRALTAPTARVVRDGAERDVPTEEIVLGDLVWLQEGDVVPADADVVELTQFLADEASLTGESLPIAKQVGDPVLAGTTVLSGRALVLVTATGLLTQYGRIGTLVASVRQPPTPLQRSLAKLVRALAIVAAVFCTAVVTSELLHGHGWGKAIIAGVSLAIAAIPEEFAIVYSLYLALGAFRLAKVNALVRRLPSVETLGSTTVICTDKTGTLTHGSLTVASASPAEGVSDVELLTAAVLACEPTPFDPLDVAIVAYATGIGIDVDRLHAGDLAVDWPFDPVLKYLTHVWKLDGAHVVAAKGSLEGMLDVANASAPLRAALETTNEEFARDGMRVIAVAGCVAAHEVGAQRADDEAGLQLRGLIAFSDPVREQVSDALAACRDAGIRVIMITGDHPATAHAVAEGLGLPHEAAGGDLIATGADLDAASEEELDRLVGEANVFARTRPEQKHLLVASLRRRGEVVAMTGDGINDAPALREADIGVAMGLRGTNVAREAASLVLVDDNFATIVAAVRGGRRIFDNLLRAFAYLIAFHPPLLFAALIVPLLDRPLLLLPVHLVLLEILLHPVVSLVFQADPADADVMHRPPRAIGNALRLRALWRPYAVGSVLAVGIIAEYLVALHRSWPEGEARALGFATLLAAQPFLLLAMRSPNRPVWRGIVMTRTLAWVLAMLTVTTVAVVEVGPFARLLKLEAFPVGTWAVVVAVALVGAWWSEPWKH